MTQTSVVGACPLDCPDGCSWIVTVENDVPIKLRGNPAHPVTDGGLCRKVYPWLEYAQDPNRLLTPLRRVAAKGSSSSPDDQRSAFEPISWDEALGEIAERFHRIIDRSGPSAIWPFSGTGNMGYLQGAHGPVGDRLWNHLGVSGHNLSICSPSGALGFGYTMGTPTGMDPEDVVHAKTVLIWGANILVSGQHWWPFVERARANGAQIVVIDPARTRTAERADLHLAPRVGSDTALALGICQALIQRGAVDESWIADHGHGFEDFRDSLGGWTIERAAATCGLESSEIEALVELLATAAPLAVKFGHGAQRHAGGGQAARAVSCIPALLGSFAHVGGGAFYSTGSQYRLNTWRAGGSHANARPRTLAMTNLVANLETADPAVEALFIYGANPVVSNPDSNGVRRALSRSDLFTVAIDLFHTPTTDYADIVLPSSMAHEHLDLNDSFVHLYLNLNQPATRPAGQCLPQTEIFRRLAAAMGLDDPALFATDQELLDALIDTPALRDAGITAETLRRDGFARLPHAARPFRPFVAGFPTVSGRFEFSSDRAEDEGMGRIPHHSPAMEVGLTDDEPGHYDLVAAASEFHLNSTFAGTRLTRSRTDAPAVAIHPDDAVRDGLTSGQRVLVSNDRGSFAAELTVNALARPGVAVCAKGWWDQDLNATVDERDSDIGQGAVFHDNRVRIAALDPTARSNVRA